VGKGQGKIRATDRKNKPYRLSIGRASAAEWVESLEEWYPDRKPDDLVFAAEKASRARKMDRLLKRVVKRLGIEKNAEGLVRTTYSLRHSHAMERLTSRKITPEDLALNMGCRMRIIERHYGSHYKIIDKIDTLSA
jgi:integrase